MTLVTRGLQFRLANALVGDVSDLTLHVGGRTFPFSAAIVSGLDYQWQNTNLTWTEGDTIPVRIHAHGPLAADRMVVGRDE